MENLDQRTATTTRREILATGGALAAWAIGGRAVRSVEAPATTARPGRTEAIKILTCNIRLPVKEDEEAGNGWMTRRQMCADVIAAQHADLIGIQEARQHQLEFLLRQMPHMQAVGLPHPDLGFSQTNPLLFSHERFAPLQSGGFWISETPHIEGSKSWDSARGRFVNWVQLKDRRTGQQLRHWNTHLDHIGQQARVQGAEMIVAAAAALPTSLPQLLTGDMNAGRTNPAIKALKAAGWIDTFAEVHGPAEMGFTAHKFLGPARDKVDGKRGRRIDWIFCRPGTRTLSAEVIREGRGDRYPSDHYFVSATVELPAVGNQE